MKNGLKIKKRTLLLFPAIFLIAIQFYDEVALLQRIDATGLKHILILLYIMIVIAKGNSERRFSFFLGYELKRVCTVTSILVAISFFFYDTKWFFNWLDIGNVLFYHSNTIRLLYISQ